VSLYQNALCLSAFPALSKSQLYSQKTVDQDEVNEAGTGRMVAEEAVDQLDECTLPEGFQLERWGGELETPL
jgi:hypothetical protein